MLNAEHFAILVLSGQELGHAWQFSSPISARFMSNNVERRDLAKQTIFKSFCHEHPIISLIIN